MLTRIQWCKKNLCLRAVVSVQCILMALLMGESAFAEESKPQAVIKIITSKLYIYTEDGEEASPKPKKAKEFTKQFSDLGIDGLDQEGLLIVNNNASEGLIAVELPGEDTPIWIELIAVEVWPGNKLQCPDAVLGQSKETDQGVTIGFGDHCE